MPKKTENTSEADFNALPEKVRIALVAVINYNWDDEREDFFDNHYPEDEPGHVFNALAVLQNFVDGTDLPVDEVEA